MFGYTIIKKSDLVALVTANKKLADERDDLKKHIIAHSISKGDQ